LVWFVLFLVSFPRLTQANYVLQEPLLFRTAVDARLRFTFAHERALLPSLTQFHVFCAHVALSCNADQAAMLLVLAQQLLPPGDAAADDRVAVSMAARARALLKAPRLPTSVLPLNPATAPAVAPVELGWSAWAWSKVAGGTGGTGGTGEPKLAGNSAVPGGMVLDVGIFVGAAVLRLVCTDAAAATEPVSFGNRAASTRALVECSAHQLAVHVISSEATGLIINVDLAVGFTY
jgi:hypothetical protein